MSEYPDNKNQRKGPDKAGQALEEFFQEFIVVMGMAVHDYGRLLVRKWYVNIPLHTALWAGLYGFCYYAAGHAWHYQFLHSLDPVTLTPHRLEWLNRFARSTHAWFLFSLFSSAILLVIGIRLRFIRTKYQKIFRAVGLVNGLQDTPVLMHEKKVGQYRTQLDFDSRSIGVDAFKAKTDSLESAFGMAVESISHGENQKFISITLTKRRLPNYITYREIQGQHPLPAESFYIGDTVEGILTQKIADLPHFMIAGTTQGGKSNFLKNTLVCLLDSCPQLHLYLIDLKNALEGIDFRDAPNVRVIDNLKDAVSLLRKMKREMEIRFQYMREHNLKQIDPQKDGRERIIIAVDESSELHMKRDKDDPNAPYAIEARSLIDSLAKLSRAAAINLILATQKIDREVIPTTVQENISGRMAFKANTLQGSLVVLGSKDALDLPAEIRGRGIWQFGSRKIMVQTPLVTEEDVHHCTQRIESDFCEGKRKFLTPMIGSNQLQQTDSSDFEKNVTQG